MSLTFKKMVEQKRHLAATHQPRQLRHSQHRGNSKLNKGKKSTYQQAADKNGLQVILPGVFLMQYTYREVLDLNPLLTPTLRIAHIFHHLQSGDLISKGATVR